MNELLDRLRANPLDDETRAVYADWLEQHGELDRAAFLRAPDLATRRALAIANPDDGAWRALVARQPLARCAALYRQGCAIPWESHAPTSDGDRRTCTTCERAVFYITTLDELERIGSTAKRCFTLDLALDETAAKDLYDGLLVR